MGNFFSLLAGFIMVLLSFSSWIRPEKEIDTVSYVLIIYLCLTAIYYKVK